MDLLLSRNAKLIRNEGSKVYLQLLMRMSNTLVRRCQLLADAIMVVFSIRVPPADNFAESEPMRAALTENSINANLVNLGVQVVVLKEARVARLNLGMAARVVRESGRLPPLDLGERFGGF